MAVPTPHVRVLWRPEQFNRCTNPGFETNTTGWSVAAGVNGTATSITRITSDAHAGSACGQLVTTASAGSGINFDLGSDRYFREADEGSMYAATVYLKRVSGPKVCKLILGSLGTSAERDELLITDLADAWRPYRVVWAPRDNDVTDAELALVTVTDGALTVNIDSVTIYAPEGFNQIENGTFATDTTGWSVDAGVTITRTTSDSYETDGTYARVDTTGGAGATDGVSYSLGTRTFTSGRTYRLRVVGRTISGNADIAIRLGDIGTDANAESITLAAAWTVYTCDWTPNADRTSVEVELDEDSNGSGVFEIAHVEVYEASDELNSDLSHINYRRGARANSTTDTPGQFALTLDNPTGTYSPENTASALYPSVEAGRAVLARADYENTGYALFHGNIDNVEPLPFEAKASITGKDALDSLGDVDIRAPFRDDASYAEGRKAAFSQALSLGQRTDPADLFGTSRLDVSTNAIEGSTFFDGTNAETSLRSYLEALNLATGALHYIKPHYDAGKPWTYKTIDRAVLTDTDAGTTIDEDFGSLDSYRAGYESLENRMRLSWQSFEEIPLALDETLGGTYAIFAQAIDPSESTYDADRDEIDPYLHFRDPRIGSGDTVQDPRTVTEAERIFTPSVVRDPNSPGYVPPSFTSRTVYPDAFVPITMDPGDTRERQVTTSIPVAEVQMLLYDGGTAADVVTATTFDPNQMQMQWWAASSATIDLFALAGRPFLPLDRHDLVIEDGESALRRGVHDAPTVVSYLSSRGAAEGLGRYRTWRYGEPRTRLRYSETARAFDNLLSLDVGSRITASFDRWYVASMPSVVRAIEVDAKADDWRAWRDIEELPTHTDWFTLDDSDKGLDDAVVLAY